VTTTADKRPVAAGRTATVEREGGALASWTATVRQSLDRPLTSYYLLIGAAGLLLVIGLVMVLSSSSVWSYEQNGGNSYATFLKQLTWVVVAAPCVLVAVRLPHRFLRALAWPALLVSVLLLALTQTSMGVTVNGNKNWLALGPL
jgi:cell division protein FtsW